MWFDPYESLNRIAARTPATPATTATQAAQEGDLSQMSRVSQGSEVQTSAFVANVAGVATPLAQKHEIDATPDQIANNILAEMRAAPNVEHMRAIRNNAPGIEAVKRGSPVRLIHMDNLIKQRESAK